MNIIDVVIILIVLCAGVVGFKRGVFKELVITVGFFLVFWISFKLKNPIAEWLSLNLPFFNFSTFFKGSSIFNIILYQFIAFLIIFSIIMILFRIVLKITGIFEKILKFTIILGIPSKIAGFIVGLVEGYIVMFVVLFFLSQPILDVGIISNSKYANTILSSSPGLTNIVSKANNAVYDISDLSKKYNENFDARSFDNDVADILLKYDIVQYSYLSKLNEVGKIHIDMNNIENYK